MKLRIYYTINGTERTTDVEANRNTDTEALREKFRKSFPGCIVHKVKAIKG